MSKLHIGTGKNYLPGWINVDIFSNITADVYADMASLPFSPESMELIYCCHTLEHSHRHMVLATLTHWYNLLKPGGILRLAVPNFGAINMWYTKTGRLDDVLGLLYGGQDNHLNRHNIVFDAKTLGRDLRKVGFVDVRPWDWRKTEHAQFDDYASAYLPHMDKEQGMLMSLNLEGVKA